MINNTTMSMEMKAWLEAFNTDPTKHMDKV
jgi:hypothetical protein